MGRNIPQGIDDFAGNLLSTTPGSIGYNFRVAVSALAAPIPTAATPDDGATDVPLNAQIQVQFDQPVASSSLDGVQLFENGSPSAFTVRVEADGRTVSVIPQRLPVPGSVDSLVAAGVKNSEGVAMASPYQSTFTMGSVVDTTSPVLRASPASGQSEVPLNAVLHVRSNKPLNKLTVNPRNISLVWTPFGNVPAGVQLQDSGLTLSITP